MFMLGIGTLWLWSCAQGEPNDQHPTVTNDRKQAATLTESKVADIARQAVATNDTWWDRAEFERPKRSSDGSWSVLVWRLPKTPGGHRLILIDERGTIAAYIRGR